MPKLKYAQAKAQVNNWLAVLGRKNDLPLCLNKDARCVIDYKGEIGCCIEVPKGGDLFFLYSPLLAVPVVDRSAVADILYQALCLNLFQIGTEGTTLSVDPCTDYFVLCYSRPIGDIEQDCFEKSVGHFLEAADSVKQGLEQIVESVTAKKQVA